MAEKKTSSRADKAVSGAKKKGTDNSSKAVSKKKAAAAKKAAEKKPPKVKTEYENAIPDNFMTAFVCTLSKTMASSSEFPLIRSVLLQPNIVARHIIYMSAFFITLSNFGDHRRTFNLLWPV